jgi:hypothetical protein
MNPPNSYHVLNLLFIQKVLQILFISVDIFLAYFLREIIDEKNLKGYKMEANVKKTVYHLQTSIPGPRATELLKKKEQHVPRDPFHTMPTIPVIGEGSLLTDVEE